MSILQCVHVTRCGQRFVKSYYWNPLNVPKFIHYVSLQIVFTEFPFARVFTVSLVCLRHLLDSPHVRLSSIFEMLTLVCPHSRVSSRTGVSTSWSLHAWWSLILDVHTFGCNCVLVFIHPCALTSMCPHVYVSSRLCVLTSMCPHVYVSSHLCVLTSMCPHVYVSSRLCVLTSMCPHVYLSSRLCVLTSICPHICSCSGCPQVQVPTRLVSTLLMPRCLIS